jgi:hypothetical protein
LAFAFLGATPNGDPVIDYSVQCTSTTGGATQTVRQTQSPIAADRLTTGASYSCAITARNSRGDSGAATVGPIVARPPSSKTLASCTGNTGTVTLNPGMLEKTAQTQHLDLSATVGCQGPSVNAGSVTFSLRARRSASCATAVGLISGGSGTIRWSAPGGMGKSIATIQLKIASTGNHQTKATFSGSITSGNSILKGADISGTLLLSRGFHATSAGGDCSSQTPLTQMPMTAITMTLS